MHSNRIRHISGTKFEEHASWIRTNYLESKYSNIFEYEKRILEHQNPYSFPALIYCKMIIDCDGWTVSSLYCNMIADGDGWTVSFVYCNMTQMVMDGR